MTIAGIPTLGATLCSGKPEHSTATHVLQATLHKEKTMGGLIYLIGLIVVIMAILSLLGLR
jgi:F0F1-type ATP synthase membrane subunit c/vacuolar-type H+-ATPase subunit K